ncbi:hypothetical protein [Agrococcus lahaulensis]|uniref:hypothetical protein n=1 Tax=Agrococcus lahaulensis TaxID=341722 RepID=UPI0012EBCC03|nr:hypothetical protein [Agrococcus lahaulensis]
MTDTLARPEVSVAAPDSVTGAAGAISWASPGSGLWVATRTDREGTTFLGFVEETLEEFVAVDGAGRSLGRFSDLREAQAAFAAGNPSPALTTGPIRWIDVGARVVTRSSLRFG